MDQQQPNGNSVPHPKSRTAQTSSDHQDEDQQQACQFTTASSSRTGFQQHSPDTDSGFSNSPSGQYHHGFYGDSNNRAPSSSPLVGIEEGSSSSNQGSKNKEIVSSSSMQGPGQPMATGPSRDLRSTPLGSHHQYPSGKASTSNPRPLGPSTTHLGASVAIAERRMGPENRVSAQGPSPDLVASAGHHHQYQPGDHQKQQVLSELHRDMKARASLADFAKKWSKQPDSPPRPSSPETLRLVKELAAELPPPTPYVPDNLTKNGGHPLSVGGSNTMGHPRSGTLSDHQCHKQQANATSGIEDERVLHQPPPPPQSPPRLASPQPQSRPATPAQPLRPATPQPPLRPATPAQPPRPATPSPYTLDDKQFPPLSDEHRKKKKKKNKK
ncbi:basic salivary proline-rich protein 2-like [Punica granatum]|uniref:Basic salivary proline-rich protein 2-like n=1 Tax=Punica granatum TaxID=22663 RepID=A0A6P8D1S9_PUNGR|nr:basic salivary proline-rich protein 2-like [Punica granatum]